MKFRVQPAGGLAVDEDLVYALVPLQEIQKVIWKRAGYGAVPAPFDAAPGQYVP